jgi:REP element-mobilizing transposase RayT
MSYAELQKGRVSEAYRIYFITTVTHQRDQFFSNLQTSRIVIRTMKDLDKSGYVQSLSWVLMPDHLHWMFQLSDKSSLAVVIKRLKAISAHSVNKSLAREGQIWQRSYYDRCIRQEEDLKQISRYIIANPLRAGLVDDIGMYPHWDAVWL